MTTNQGAIMTQYPDMRMSMELNNAFDGSAYSEYARQLYYRIDPVMEVLRNSKCDKKIGSFAEGTDIYESDRDFLFSDTKGIKVGYNPLEAGSDSGKPYLCLTKGPFTSAGYTKFQIYLNDKSNDNNYKKALGIFFHHKMYISHTNTCFLTNKLLENPHYFTNHGPALTSEWNNGTYLDGVIAYESKIIPNDMNNWFDRTRLNSWPSKTTRELFRSMGCYYVGVGRSNSPEQDLEWRISPSLQELYLMLNLNPTQFRCYVILKMIKKYWIQKFCGDIISSYHCKTALFWTIENNDSDIWQPDNLVICVLMCFRTLIFWVTDKRCPNYFIPEENMFESKLIDEIQVETIKEHLLNLISVERYSVMHKYVLSLIMRQDSEMHGILRSAFLLKGSFFEFSDASSIADHIITTQKNIELIKINRCNSYIQEFQAAVSPNKLDIDILLEMLEEKLLCLNRCVHLKSVIEGKTLTEKDIMAHLNDMSQKSHRDIDYCLKLASIAALRGQYSLCDVLLQKVYGMARVDIVCDCCVTFRIDGTNKKRENIRKNVVKDNIILLGKPSNQLTLKDILGRFTFCLKLYDKEYEAGLEMYPLNFDAYKTVVMSLEVSVPLLKICSITSLDPISIHPIIYLYFLQYKNSGMMKNKGDMCVALEKLEHMNLISLQKEIYSHPDTTINLLGHIYTTKGWYRLAVQCFRRSWKIQPHYNAVQWHVMFMLFNYLRIP